MVVRVQTGWMCASCLPSWLHGWTGAVAHCGCPASWEGVGPHITSPGKEPNSIFKLRFLLNACHFCTFIMLKNYKSNHQKLGTICICFMVSELWSCSPTGKTLSARVQCLRTVPLSLVLQLHSFPKSFRSPPFLPLFLMLELIHTFVIELDFFVSNILVS